MDLPASLRPRSVRRPRPIIGHRERRIDIPAALAYGNAGNGNIPPDAELVFDVTLLSDSGSSGVP